MWFNSLMLWYILTLIELKCKKFELNNAVKLWQMCNHKSSIIVYLIVKFLLNRDPQLLFKSLSYKIVE